MGAGICLCHVCAERISLYLVLRHPPLGFFLGDRLLLALFVFEVVGIHSIFFSQWYLRHTGHVERYETYPQIADYINEHIPQEKTIAMEEIGIVGYFIENKIWDLHKLIHDAREFPNLDYVTEPERYPILLSLMNPDYVVLNSGRWFQSPFYRQSYRLIKLFTVSEFPWDPIFYYLLAERIEKGDNP